jgi:hypothetical protein
MRDVCANASQRFLVANDVLVIAALPHGATLTGTFIDAPWRERLEAAAHDLRESAGLFGLIGQVDDALDLVRHDNKGDQVNAMPG